MEIQVRLATILLDKAEPPREETAFRVETSDGINVQDLIEELGLPPKLVGTVIVNKRRSRLAVELFDGDRVVVLPAISGG